MIKDVFYTTSAGRIHMRVAGDPALPPLLLLHSNGCSAHEFDGLAVQLADRFHVAAWDMPGQGASDRRRGHFAIGDYVSVALEIGAALFDRRPIVGGSSIGAVLALAIGADHPDQVAAIVPIELPISRDGGWWAQHWPMVEAMFACPDEPVDRVRARYRDLTPDLAARLRVDRHKAGAWAMMDVLWAGREDADAIKGRIGRLRVPSLFVNGDRGVATDAAERLAFLNPAARLTVVADSGHFPQVDDAAAVARAIVEGFSA